jgi:hypothetical protein
MGEYITYPSPCVLPRVAYERERPEGAPRDHIQCAVVLKDCLRDVLPTLGRKGGIVFHMYGTLTYVMIYFMISGC